MDTEQAKNLLRKYNSGQCTDTEKELLESSFYEFNEQGIDISFSKLRILKQQVRKGLPKPNYSGSTLKLWISLTTAAAVITLIFFLFRARESNNLSASMGMAEQILPVGNAAQIKLSNGKVIQLDQKKDEVKIGAFALTYKDGSIIGLNDITDEQTISTPRGGEYKIVLSDGTKVWLNAATVLQYPTSFKERTEREVKLVSGEAYFEVSKDKKHPFIVSTGNQRITVLGTRFDINTYEKNTTTTLLEGSVKLNSLGFNNSTLLSPGEQAVNHSGKLLKSKVDTTLVTAWKNGKLKFRDASLKSVLDEAERWYDIEVNYKGRIPELHLTGGISRKSSLATLLKLLKLSGINFSLKEVSGRKKLSIESL